MWDNPPCRQPTDRVSAPGQFGCFAGVLGVLGRWARGVCVGGGRARGLGGGDQAVGLVLVMVGIVSAQRR